MLLPSKTSHRLDTLHDSQDILTELTDIMIHQGFFFRPIWMLTDANK